MASGGGRRRRRREEEEEEEEEEERRKEEEEAWAPRFLQEPPLLTPPAASSLSHWLACSPCSHSSMPSRLAPFFSRGGNKHICQVLLPQAAEGSPDWGQEGTNFSQDSWAEVGGQPRQSPTGGGGCRFGEGAGGQLTARSAEGATWSF